MAEKQLSDVDAIKVKAEEQREKHRELMLKKQQLKVRYIRRVGPREKEIPIDDDSRKLKLIIKGDVNGSVEAILNILGTYKSHHLCEVKVVHYGVGPITETDVDLASTFNGI